MKVIDSLIYSAKSVDYIPRTPHFAIITFEQVSIDDGWGNTNSEMYPIYTVFMQEDDWKTYISIASKRNELFVPIKATPAIVDVEVKVTIN